MFAIGSDDAAYHIWQTTPGGGWSSWASLGGTCKQISVVANQDGRLEVFAIGSDDAAYHIWQTTPGGGWSSWTSLGGKIKRIGASRQPNGTLQVIALGIDDESYRIAQNTPSGGWDNWQRVFMDNRSSSSLSALSGLSFVVGSSISSNLFMAVADTMPSSPSSKKTTKELAEECVYEIAKATAATSAATAAAGSGLTPVAIAAIVLAGAAITSASQKCSEAIDQGFEPDSSDGSDKSTLRGIDEPHYYDYEPSHSGVMVA
ncbi:hypothetical protein [Pseudanabaena yagii]|uniref:PLL-like beta propeller domain-containing protein n=1 Tax=Pseudanabaena yagii GIHE-NHR1 TaxID=2722753 RepID=A0ABX1M4Q7_9CYAN|nr:hypothetical protein [Pseudanabaena yagii GIHE-NHR1]